jgi:hypothetical protein
MGVDFPEPEERTGKDGHESDDESDVDEVEDIPLVEVDVSGLTPLSPEVISKQVRGRLSIPISVYRRREERRESACAN